MRTPTGRAAIAHCFFPASQRAVTEAKDAAVWPEGKEKSSGCGISSCTSVRMSHGRMRATSGLRRRLQRTASMRSAAASTQPTRRVLRNTSNSAVSVTQRIPESPRRVIKPMLPSSMGLCRDCRNCRKVSSAFIKLPLSRFVVYRIKSVTKGCAACIGKCRSKGLGAFPNKRFATQNKQMYIRLHCLLQWCWF